MIQAMGEGVADAVAALRNGEAVALPLPSPLPYGVFGTRVDTVNRAKGRPGGQPAGIIVDDFGPALPHFAVAPEVAQMVPWLCVVRQLNVFVPVSDTAPDWLRQDPALTGGTVGVMGSWLAELRGVLDALGPLYVSSANATGQAVATTAPEADAAFDGRLLVVDGDAYRTPGVRHGSATIVSVAADGTLSIARHGVNDDGHDAGAFLTELTRQYAHDR